MNPLTRGVAGALVSTLCVAATMVGPATRAVAKDLDVLRAEAQAVADDVSRLEHSVAGLERKAERLDDEIAATSQALGRIELEREEAEAAYMEATDTLVERAVIAYKADPSTRMSLLLSSETLADVYAMAEVTSAIARADAAAVERVGSARSEAEAAIAAAEERKARLIAAKAEADAVADETSRTLAERRRALRDLQDRIVSLEAKARRAARALATGSGIDTSQALLDILGPSGPSTGIPAGFAPTGVSFEGIASWYGPGFEGNLTANGDVFDSRLYTAASKTLPLPSWLYVEHEGRGVVVLVNDRGPYVGDRVLDLSHAAAQAIGISGLGWVKAEVLIET